VQQIYQRIEQPAQGFNQGYGAVSCPPALSNQLAGAVLPGPPALSNQPPPNFVPYEQFQMNVCYQLRAKNIQA